MLGLSGQLQFTLEGKMELANEVACLEEVRGDILREAQRTSSGGNSSVRNQLDAIEEQIRRLHWVLDSGSVVENTGFLVAIGTEVTIVDEAGKKMTFTIGGPLAANPHFACVSYESPLGRAVLGSQLGETVEVISARDRKLWRIVGLRPGRPECAQSPNQLACTPLEPQTQEDMQRL